MRPIQPYRRRSSTSFWLGLFLVFFMTGSGIFTVLFLLGVNLNPFGAKHDDPFMVRIPINTAPIPAYERVDRVHLINPSTGGLQYQRIPPQATVGMSIVGIDSAGSHVEGKVQAISNVKDEVIFEVADGRRVPQSQTIELGGALLNVNSIIGRVVKRDKRAGLGFQEENFFPIGTPAGLAGATPPGMRTMLLDASKIKGVYALHVGDSIDLMASVPLDQLGTFNLQQTSRLPGAALVGSGSKSKANGSATTQPILLAENAVVLKPVSLRNEATTSSSLTQGKRIQNVPKYEVAIAVAPDDVIPLQCALDKNLELTCIAHSMQTVVNEPSAAETIPTGPVAPVTVRPILAYDVVTRDAFVNHATRRIRLEPVSPEQINRQGIITSVDQAIGSVARHDIPVGSFIRRSDLLSGSSDSGPGTRAANDRSAATAPARNTARSPLRFAAFGTELTAQAQPAETPSTTPSIVGDRPSVTSFVPPERTAFAMPWNRLYGAEHLQIGDHVDLLASYSLESEDEEEETETRPDGTKIVRKRNDIATRTTLRTWDESFGGRGEPWFVAIDAIVIAPVGFPAPAPALRALGEDLYRETQSGETTKFSGPPVIVAVDERDIEPFAAALATKRVIFTAGFHGSGDKEPIPDGMRNIAVAAQDIAPYEAITETVWQGNRRRTASRLVRADDPRFKEALDVRDFASYHGRVLQRAKRRMDFFVAEDFLPPGTKPGFAAAVVSGQSVFAAPDREIEGLDSFLNGDRVAVLVRGVVKPPQGVIAHGFNLQRPISSVIVPNALILRASRAGQTILQIDNSDLTHLQAALAASMSAQVNGQQSGGARSHLLAVGLPREVDTNKQIVDPFASTAPNKAAPLAAIPDYDPHASLRAMETLIGSRRQIHVFAGRETNNGEPLRQDTFNFVGQ